MYKMYDTHHANGSRIERAPRDFAEQTFDLFVPTVVTVATCVKHNAGQGEYCHTFDALDHSRVIGGICNQRAKKAGFDAPIKESSLRARPKLV